jgi:hypothetical protein
MARPMGAKYYGYVEPDPELFARAAYIVEYLRKGLESKNLMTEDVKDALKKTGLMLEALQKISERELGGMPLTEEEYQYISETDKTFRNVIESLASSLVVEVGEKPRGKYKVDRSMEGADEAFQTPVVADVHTEGNTNQALEVGTGHVDWVIVAHASKDGRIGLAVGPMFSYYEFPWSMSDRLTDEKWRDMLKKGPPPRPAWIEDFIR